MPHTLPQVEDLKKLTVAEPDESDNSIKGGEHLDLRRSNLAELPDIDLPRLQHLASVMRGFMFIALEASQSGHPGGSSAKTEQLLALTLSGVMAVDFLNPKHPGRDRFVWSAGHCTPAHYSLLALLYEILRRAGRQFSSAVIEPVFPEDLLRFRHPDGPQGHVESHYPLSDIGTGPSGHGLSAAGGLAISHRASGLDTKVWVLMGDAESEEGMSYEARNLLATNNINNLIVSLDYNHFGIDGPIEEVVSSPYINHWRGLGWNVIEVDGHNLLELIYAYRLASRGFENRKPTVVICHGIKGKYYGKKENTAESHGSPAKHDEYVQIMKSLGFDIPGEPGKPILDLEKVLEAISQEDEIYVARRLEEAAEKIKPEADLVHQMKKALKDHPLIDPRSIQRPEQLPTELCFAPDTNVATRKATQAWFEWLMKQSGFFYAGTGDLSKSILIDKAEKIYGLISPANPLGRGLRFGIAEQNMAMMYTALTQDILPGGFRPISVFSTYAVFTSMFSNCVRLALINNQLNPKMSGFFIVLAAHDGPETGEDGPTHQGLFWMSFYNAFPGIKVYKPLDANETIEMLFYALEKGEPIALSVARPDTHVFKRGNGVPPAREATNGAYIFRDFQTAGGKKIVLAVCGGQMMVNTMTIVPELEKQGLDVKVVAVTSPELFEELRKNDPQKAEKIFSTQDRERVIAIHNGWRGFLYPFSLPPDYTSRTIAIDTYLRSGNPKEVYELAGLTSEDIKKKILMAID